MTMAAPLVPHRLGSIVIPRRVATRTFTPGDPAIQVELKNLGYLDRILVRIAGTVTVDDATPDPRPGFPYNLVKRFLLELPGMDDPIDVSGFSAKMQQLVGYSGTMLRHGGDPIADTRTGLANAFFDASVRDNFPITVSTANAWNLMYVLDPKRSYRDHRGILPMSADNGDSILSITPATLAELFDVPGEVTATALTVTVTQLIRTPPVAGVSAPDLGWVVRYDEQTDVVSATGEFDVRLRQEGILLNAIAHVVLDDDAVPNAAESSINSVSLIVNEDARIDGQSVAEFMYLQAEKYGRPLPAGVFAFDFDADAADVPYVDAGQERAPGWVALNRGYEAVLRFDIASGATLDNAKIITSTKRLVRA